MKGIIYSLLASYIFDVPSIENFKVWKLNFSEKFFIYILAFQMLLSNFPFSVLAGVCGFLAGMMYRFKPLKLKYVTWPNFIVTICQKIQPHINRPLNINRPDVITQRPQVLFTF
jgi:hypothetical protein